MYVYRTETSTHKSNVLRSRSIISLEQEGIKNIRNYDLFYRKT